MNITRPILIIKFKIEHSQANSGNKAIIPTPINNVPKHPLEEASLVLREIKYPIGIATKAIINPITISLPSGNPRSKWSYNLPFGLCEFNGRNNIKPQNDNKYLITYYHL